MQGCTFAFSLPLHAPWPPLWCGLMIVMVPLLGLMGIKNSYYCYHL